MFETAGLPEHLVQQCNAMDEIWTCTEFNKETFTRAGGAHRANPDSLLHGLH